MTTRFISRAVTGLLLAGASLSCGGGKAGHDATGTFEATEILVSSEATGKILHLNVEEGQLLQAGAPLGIVDTVQLSLKKRQLEATLAAVASRRADVAKQVAATRQQVAAAKTERQRFEQLVKMNAANQKQVDDIDAQIAVLERQRAAQEATLEEHNKSIAAEGAAIEIQIAQVVDQLQKCRISSPVTGTALVKYAEAGEVAVAGKPLFKVADMERVFLRAYVTSALLSRVKPGQGARLLVEYGDDGVREYAGRVVWISDKAEFTPKSVQTRDERANQVYAVKIATRNDGWLKIGMYGEVIFGEE
jgi:HlyD family secretion protein